MSPNIHLTRPIYLLLAGILLALTWMSTALASGDKQVRTEALTQSLAQQNYFYREISPGARSEAIGQLLQTARERKALLTNLIKEDPDAVLRLAMPGHVRSKLPPEVQSLVEQHMELEGQLVVSYEDHANGSNRLRHELKTGEGTVSLHFRNGPGPLISGVPAIVGGLVLDDAMVLESGGENVMMLAADGGEISVIEGSIPELPNTVGEQNTLVLMVNFADDPFAQPWTQAEVTDVVFGQTDEFFFENSAGLTWLSGDVHGWYTIAMDSFICDSNGLMDAANQLAIADGIDLAAYQRIVYFHVENACGWSGLATLGGMPTTALINGTIDPRIVGHELGHTLGLHHAHGLDCGSEVLGSECQNVEYGDSLDIMGSRISHFNAFHKERMGWLDNQDIVVVEDSGSYTLEPFASPQGADPKTLKILKEVDSVTGLRTWYFLEYRQAIGFDGAIATDPAYDSENILNGILVRTGKESDGQSSNMLDMTPGSDLIFDWFDSALEVGQSFSDPETGVVITPTAADASGANVSISLSVPDPVCLRANPSLSFSPAESDWLAPGSAFSFTVTLENNDSVECGGGSFDLAAAAPANWSASFNQSLLDVEPGASGQVNLTVVSPTSAPDGFHDIGVSAENAADVLYSATDLVTYIVSAPPEVPVNQPPVAADDNITLAAKTAIDIHVMGNDYDLDGDSLWVSGFTSGAKGDVSLNPDGSLRYVPGKRFKSTDSFTYTISDGEDSSSATVLLTLQESSDGGGGRPGGGKGKPKK